MIIDNYVAHGDDLPEPEGVAHIVLPPNVISLFQPFDMRIIATIKRHTRKEELSQLIQTMDNQEELRRAGKNMKQGTAGIKYSMNMRVLDAF